MKRIPLIFLAATVAAITMPANASPTLDEIANATDGLYEPSLPDLTPSSAAANRALERAIQAADGLYEPAVAPVDKTVHVASFEVFRHYSGASWRAARDSSLENVRINLQNTDD